MKRVYKHILIPDILLGTIMKYHMVSGKLYSPLCDVIDDQLLYQVLFSNQITFGAYEKSDVTLTGKFYVGA